MKLIGKILIVLVVLLVAGAAAGIAVLMATDTDQFRALIAEQVKSATGRELRIKGALDLQISLTPVIEIGEVSLANAPWGSRPEMVSLKRLEVELDLLPMLKGEFRVGRIILIEPDILLETDAEGGGNWQFAAGAGKSRETGENGAAAAPVIPVVGRLRIDDGKIVFRGGGDPVRVRIRSLALGSEGPEDSLRLSFDGAVNDIALTLNGTLGSFATLVGQRAYPVDVTVKALSSEAKIKGRVTAPLERNLLDFSLSVGGQSLRQTMTAAGAMVPPEIREKLPEMGPFSVSAKISGAPEKIALSEILAKLGSPETIALTVSGKIDDPHTLGGLVLDIAADGRDLTPFTALAGAALPDLPPFKVSTRFTMPPGHFAFDTIKARLGASSVNGNIRLFLAGPRPRIEGAIAIQALNIDELLKSMPASKPVAPNRKRSAGDGRVFSADLLPLQALRDVDLGLKLVGDRVTVNGFNVTSVIAGIDLKAGKLAIDPLSAKLAQGRLGGTIRLDGATKVPELSLAIELGDLDLGQILKQLADSDLLKGRLDAEIDLKGRGKSLRAVMGSLNGRTQIVMNGGEVGSRYLDLLAADLVTELIPWAKKANVSKINCLVSRFQVRDGLAVSKGLLLDAGEITVAGEGDINLKTEKLNFKITPRPKEASLVSLAVPINIGGTLADPTFAPDPLSVAKGVAGLALGLVNPLGLLVGTIDSGAGDKNACLAALAQAGKAPAKAAETPPKKTEDSGPAGVVGDVVKGVGEGIKGVGEGVGNVLKSLFGGK